MTLDILAPSVARTSAAMILTKHDKRVLIFRVEGFQLPAPSQYREIIEIASFCAHDTSEQSKTYTVQERVNVLEY